jgi:hypothetical protein
MKKRKTDVTILGYLGVPLFFMFAFSRAWIEDHEPVEGLGVWQVFQPKNPSFLYTGSYF